MFGDNSLNSLLAASNIIEMLDSIKMDLALKGGVEAIKGLKTPQNPLPLPQSGPLHAGTKAATRPSTSWAEVMEDVDPIKGGDLPGDEETCNTIYLSDMPHTEEYIRMAFEPMRNADRCQLQSKHTVLKLEVTKMPGLKFTADGCLKSTKAADKAV